MYRPNQRSRRVPAGDLGRYVGRRVACLSRASRLGTEWGAWAAAMLALIIAACSSPALASAADPSDAVRTAASMVEASGASGGCIAVLGCDSAELPVALAQQGSFVVQVLAADRAQRDKLREEIRGTGLYGSVSADVLAVPSLPYADNLLNLVVIDNFAKLESRGLSVDEIRRVLAPLGTAYLGGRADSRAWAERLCDTLAASKLSKVAIVGNGRTWVRFSRPWPQEIDHWTHYLHGADGNPVAEDTVVGPPKHFQWTAGPTWLRSHETDSSVSTLVTAGGRLFAIVDEAPISLPGDHPLPDKWFLVARDVFNGVLLWKVPIRRWGWREWKLSWFNTRPGDVPLNLQKRLVATDDKVYVTLGYQAPVSQLDARTGHILQTYDGTERTGEILYLDGILVLSVLRPEGVRVMAVDAESGRPLWTSQQGYRGSTTDYIRWKAMRGSTPAPQLDPALNMATDGDVVALIDEDQIVGLDFKTGRQRWQAPFPTDPADHSSGGIKAGEKLWVGTMIAKDGVVLHASPNALAAFSSDSGEMLWKQPKRYIGHLWYEWKDVFVIDGLVWTWSAELEEGFFDIGRGRRQRELWPVSVNGYDLDTGRLEREVPLGAIFKTHHHHRCYRNKATLRYILASRRGTEYVDLKEGNHTVHNWVRGTCHVGMMPACGMQIAPPHPCVCYIDEKLNGFVALAPARPGDERLTPSTEEALEPGPAIESAEGPAPEAGDWPAFRADAMRTGSVDTQLGGELDRVWRVDVGRRVSPPIVVGDRVFVALVDEHHVACLDATSGQQLWQFATGGRVDSPPTYSHGKLYFGSADGSVYCLRANDGALVWRFRAAPDRRLMSAMGQLESTWPVHGSVLVQDGKVYFAAGRSSQLDSGIFLYALDAKTGKPIHTTTLEGPHYTVHDIETNFKLPMGALPDVMMGDGTKVYMRNLAFDAALNRVVGQPSLQPRSGFLEDTYFKRAPWSFGARSDYARLIVHDARRVYFVRMFDSLRGLDPTVFFTPGAKGYLLFAKNMEGERQTWSDRVLIRIRAMALTPDKLLVAGPPDVVDPDDPLGAFEGRKGGILQVVETNSGEKLSEYRLPSPPVFNGIAAARGRLFLAEKDGSVSCYATPQR